MELTGWPIIISFFDGCTDPSIYQPCSLAAGLMMSEMLPRSLLVVLASSHRWQRASGSLVIWSMAWCQRARKHKQTKSCILAAVVVTRRRSVSSRLAQAHPRVSPRAIGMREQQSKAGGRIYGVGR